MFTCQNSDHPQYGRWLSMIARCHNPNNASYCNTGAIGIRIEDCWCRTNPDGFINYVSWIENQLMLYPEFQSIRYKVARFNTQLNYGPANCHLVAIKGGHHTRINNALTEAEVIQMRKHRKQTGDSLMTMEILFKHPVSTISRCLRGVSWSCVNTIEPPILTLV